MKKNKYNLIVLSGGGTAGSVSPLLAVAEGLASKYEFLLVGTHRGPERQMASELGIDFIAISSGKFRRYFSLMNLVDIIFIVIAFFQSLVLLIWKRPRIVMTAGSFVSVPLVWASAVLRIPVHVHQQDLRSGLANKLMAPFAKYITVSFESSLKDFRKAVWTGNPSRKMPNAKCQMPNAFEFQNGKPILLFLGGGTGAEVLNDFVRKFQNELLDFCNIVINTGKNKGQRLMNTKGMVVAEFFNAEEISQLQNSAQLVITRCGLATLSELAVLAKPTLLVPIPKTHQEDNAIYFAGDDKSLIIQQEELNADFIPRLQSLISNQGKLSRIGENIHSRIKPDATKNVTEALKL